MNYTDEQVKFLMRFENEGKWSEAAAENLDLLLMLDKDGLLSHHEDTKPDCITLTEKGKQVIFSYRKKIEALEKEAEEKRLAEENRIKELAKADADKKADRAIDQRFQLINSLFTAAIGGAITLTVEHFSSIVSFIKELFQ